MTRRAERLGFLDTLRGGAILGVAIFHALGLAFGVDELPWAGRIRDVAGAGASRLLLPAYFGYLGVAVFFVVSGFCIHLSHARSGEASFGAFFVRRFFRIYPPYLASLLLFSFLSPWGKVDLGHGAGLADFGSHVALLHNLVDDHFFSINPSFWSIAVEVQLYALYPILWTYAQRRGWARTLAITAAVEFVIRVAGELASAGPGSLPLPRWAGYNPFAFWFCWCLGAAIAEGHLARRLPAVKPGSLCLAAGALFAAYFFRPAVAFLFPLTALVTGGLIIHLLARPQALRPVPSQPRPAGMLARLGVVSYSFYLLHQPVLALVPRGARMVFPDRNHPYLCFIVILALLVPVYYLSLFFYRWVELPSVAAGQRLLARRRGTVSVLPPAEALAAGGPNSPAESGARTPGT